MIEHVHQLRVAIVGAGGLGGPIAYGLAAAGVGELRLFDDDAVELSNLQRQVQFTTGDIGRPKVEALASELVRRGVAPHRIQAFERRVDAGTREAFDVDLTIDASDDPPTKFLVNDIRAAMGEPCVIASALRYGGQVMTVIPGRGGCYRCLFEEPPPAEDSMSCAEAGVLGAAVAVIAGHAVRAALSVALGPRDGHRSELLVITDVRSPTPRRSRFNRRGDCCCASRSTPPLRQEVV